MLGCELDELCEVVIVNQMSGENGYLQNKKQSH